ncbi:hypothetical protein SBADM41S_10629 [Streptomyces badius]
MIGQRTDFDKLIVDVETKQAMPPRPAEVLAAKVRDPGVHVVRPHGLTLEEVAYPADALLAARAEEARNVRRLPGAGCC